MFAFSEKGDIPTDEKCKNQILTEWKDAQSKQCRASIPTGTQAKHLHLLETLALPSELL